MITDRALRQTAIARDDHLGPAAPREMSSSVVEQSSNVKRARSSNPNGLRLTKGPSTSPNATSLLDLPDEILTQTLLPLSVLDIFHSQAACSKLNSIVTESVEIQYRVALEISKLEKSELYSSLSTSERLDRLLKGQKAWNELNPQFVTPFNAVERRLSGDCLDLRGGIYAPGSDQMAGVELAVLPATEGEAIVWKLIGVQEECIDVGLSGDEHDLIAILTTTPLEDTPGTSEIALHLRQLSTGKPHPKAEQPRIVFCRSDRPLSNFKINIVGNNLIARFTSPNDDEAPFADRLIVSDWKTGAPKASLAAPKRSYSGFTFLEEKLLLVSNARFGTLEIWNLPATVSAPPPSAPVCVLGLPLLVSSGSYRSIRCHGEPSPHGMNKPTGVGGQAFQNRQRPYQCNAEEAIVAFDVRITVQQTRDTCPFSFFVHRNSLLQVVEAHRQTSPPSTGLDTFGSLSLPLPVPWEQWGETITRWVEAPDIMTRWVAKAAGQRAVFIPKIAWLCEASLVVMDFNPWTVKKCRYALAEEERKMEEKGEKRHWDARQREDDTEAEGGLYNDWECMALAGIHSEVRAPMGGSEIVHHPEGPPAPLHGTDAHAKDEAQENMDKESDPPPEGNTKRASWMLIESDVSVDIGGHFFLSPVVSKLPYVCYLSREHFKYNAVLMDEERILGVKTNSRGWVEKFEVQYFG